MKESWNWPKIRIVKRIKVNPDTLDYAQRAVDESHVQERSNYPQPEALARAWDEGHSVGYHGESSDLNPYGSNS